MTTTEALTAPLAEFLADRIPRAAAKAHRRFPAVPAEDFEQAMWEKTLTNPLKFHRLFDQGRYGIIWTELSRAATKLGAADDRWRRAEKAALNGYRLDDESFYSLEVLRFLLPILMDADLDAAEAFTQTVGKTDLAGIRIANPDPAAVEVYMASLADVASAFGCVSRGDQRLLWSYYQVNQEDTSEGRWDRQKLASSMGLTYEALTQRARRALIRLQEKLGGENPWQRH